MQIINSTLQNKARRLGQWKKYRKTAAQVALKWNAQHGVSIIPKSVHVEKMEQNINIRDFNLTEEEYNALTTEKTAETNAE